jgi:hypothetical protein
MKATLTFDLDDEQDAQAHFRCVKALDMALAMWALSGRLRRVVEDGEGDEGDALWDAWNETMEEYGIKFDELIR